MPKKKWTEKALMEKYSDYLLGKGERPANVYTFTKDLGLSEGEFYKFFAGFDALEAAFLSYFFDESVKVTTKIKDYSSFSAEEKLLNLYYTFIENLTINRSLVLTLLDTDFRSQRLKFRPLKKRHRAFLDTLDLSSLQLYEKLPERVKKHQQRSTQHLLWAHLLSVLKFWKEDQSPDFEKTDIYIEKTIDTGFEVMNSPIKEKLFDLGKFLWKEAF